MAAPDRYGWPHRRTRNQWEPIVLNGYAYCTEPICLMPDRWINPDEPWDLAHNRETGEWRGPAHQTCNRTEGATYLAALHAPTPSTCDW